jgi:hypothetical protein
VSDRTVHAAWEQMEVVRYDRAGKWYLEPVGFPNLPRQHVGVREAARYALWAADTQYGWIKTELPGGAAFDRAVRRLDGMDE